jgi:DNA-binding IclR family transcriptional regulator
LRVKYLRKLTGETISLDIKWGLERITVHQLIGYQNISFINKEFTDFQFWKGAIGRSLLSQLPENELEIITDNIKLVPLTPYTIIDKQVFKQEINKAKQNKYAISFNETDLGVAAISVPIENYVVLSSITVIGPENRLAPRTLEYLEELKTKAHEISESLLKIKISIIK